MKKLTVLFILFWLVLTATSCVIPSAVKAPQAPPPPPMPNSSASPPPPSPPSPTPITLSPAPIQEVTQSTEQIPRRYAWDYDSRQWTIELTIPETLYNYYKEIPRPPTQNYSVYVTHPLDDTYVRHLVEEIEKTAQDEGFDELATVGFTAAFVQSLPYTADSITTGYDEYPRYPVETLVDNGGDCEDTSILMASLLNGLGYEVILITFPEKHLAIGVSASQGIDGAYFEHDGEKYFYLETTNTGWGVGQIPDEMKGLPAHTYDMTPTPILTHNWDATIRGNTAEMEITVENLGSQSADDVYVLVGFDAGGGKLWNPEESETFDLPIDQSITITVTLRVPLEKHTRLMTQIVDNGNAVDESYSEWFDT